MTERQTMGVELVAADNRLHRFLLARHLEVFVPKPNRRNQEGELLGSLDDLLLREEIPMALSSKAKCEALASSWASVSSWENVVCGYSTYQTDGHFLGGEDLDRIGSSHSVEREAGGTDTLRRDRLKNYWRETTLVIKFILTNYATVVQPRDQCLENMVGGVDAEGEKENIVAGLHLRDIGDHIVGEIERGVLWNEEEVWAHSWYTVLDRRCTAKRVPPIVLNVEEKTRRFAAKADRVLCVIDYIDDLSLKLLAGDGWAASRGDKLPGLAPSGAIELTW
jgi:hypothetical protein